MFAARLQGHLLRKVLDSRKGLVPTATAVWECKPDGLEIKAMYNTQSTMVSVTLHAGAFDSFHCDRQFSMGMNLGHVSKVFQFYTDADTIVTIKAQDQAGELAPTCSRVRSG